jgi:hypothetical protein
MRPPTRAPERSLSALEVLDREEERTWDALKRSFLSAGEELPGLGEVRELARRHPGLAVAGSAALGALLAPLFGRVARAALPVLLQRWSRRLPRSPHAP